MKITKREINQLIKKHSANHENAIKTIALMLNEDMNIFIKDRFKKDNHINVYALSNKLVTRYYEKKEDNKRNYDTFEIKQNNEFNSYSEFIDYLLSLYNFISINL